MLTLKGSPRQAISAIAFKFLIDVLLIVLYKKASFTMKGAITDIFC